MNQRSFPGEMKAKRAMPVQAEASVIMTNSMVVSPRIAACHSYFRC